MERRISLKFAPVCLLMGLALAAVPVEAGTDSWTVTGSPSGGYVNKVVINPTTPSILYAASQPGLFQSTDSGASWTLVLPALNGAGDVAVDPLSPSTVYAVCGCETGSLFKSKDGGATWNEMDSGIADTVSRISVDPVDAGVVYAVTLNTGLYKSTDGGGHWAKIDTGLGTLMSAEPHAFLYPVTVDPVNPQVLYLATQVTGINGGAFSDHAASGLYQSTDGGAHWAQRVDHMGFDRVVVDPSNDQNVYAGGAGVYASTDGGTTWNPASSPVDDVVAVDPTNSQHIWGSVSFTGLYETTDGGTTWNPATLTAGINVNNLVYDPVTPVKLYAASDFGVFKSVDGGAGWTQSTTGIHSVVPNLMFEGSDEVLYLASGGQGIYKSSDQGATWSEAGGGVTGTLPITADFVYALVEDPTATTTLYAGSTQGLFKTTDGGNTWTETDTGIPSPDYIFSLAVDPEVPATVYAGTDSGTGTGLYKSVDGGAHWASAANGITVGSSGGLLGLAVDPHNSKVVYAGAFTTGLYKSTDGGASWSKDDSGMPVTDVWAVAVDPKDSNVVYASSTDGFYKSTDAGATWKQSDSGLNGYIMTAIQIDPVNTSLIYVSPRYGIGDAYVSGDAGATWTPLSTGLTGSATTQRAPSTQSVTMPGSPEKRVTQSQSTGAITINAVAVDPKHHTQVFGGGSDGQIYTYNDLNPPGGGGGKGGGGATSSGGGGGAFGGLSLLFCLLGVLGRKRATKSH